MEPCPNCPGHGDVKHRGTQAHVRQRDHRPEMQVNRSASSRVSASGRQRFTRLLRRVEVRWSKDRDVSRLISSNNWTRG
jgi:hypothetical protein